MKHFWVSTLLANALILNGQVPQMEMMHRIKHHPFTESFAPLAAPPLPSATARMGQAAPSGTVIMNTTYDLGSNKSTPERIFRRADGTMAVVWTGSTDMGGGWPDRGTFYVFHDGTSWSAPPSSRLETIRTGWPGIGISASGAEISVSHDFTNFNLVMMRRAAAGTGPWTQSLPGLTGSWPRMTIGGAAGETVHLINANYSGGTSDDAYIQYSRSPDAGATWDITTQVLAGINTTNGYARMGGDAYAIDAAGNTVAVAGGNSNNHLTLWKSTDNGTTFTRYVIMTHPIPGMDGNQITDIDSDGTADIIQVHDGAHEVLIDQNGLIHVWSGAMGIIDDDPTDGGWSYYPGWNGLWYWNEGMGTDSLIMLTGALDLDGDTTLNGIGNGAPGIGAGLSSMPAASIDTATGTIYLVYSAAVEFTDYFEDPADAGAQSFRDLYGMYTSDGGATWSQPANLTRSSKLVEPTGNFTGYENVYPTTPHYADGQVHTVWQRDQEPGHALEGTPDPIGNNEIVYQAFTPADFNVSNPPMAIYSDSTPGYGGRFWFKDLSSNEPHWWIWTFGDGDTSNAKNPYKKYSTDNNYQVCLRAVNFDGWDDTCLAIDVQNVGVQGRGLPPGMTLYPNPVTDRIMIRFPGTPEGTMVITDMLGTVVFSGTLKNEMAIEPENFPAGVYMLAVKAGHQAGMVRFLVAR